MGASGYVQSENTQDLKQSYIRQNYEKMLCIVFVLCHTNKKLTQLRELYCMDITKLMTLFPFAVLMAAYLSKSKE